ncbi:universal stress protein [Desertimonas flava]|uniref:universal stress protein n=1 Tax=Desertimonas flava TaxID=2064846 RepID=UPI000E34424B|nr:universal stress protein [Desertimonas flava]
MELILVGAAESETAAKALDRAGQIAAALGGRLLVVTAYGSDEVDVIGVGSDTFVLSTADHAQEFVAREAARLSAAYGIDAQGLAISGKPHTVLIDQAKAHGATLIVVGNVRMQGVGRVLGSVANDVTHHAPCDVYVVKTS